jgi:hypothetical protein
MYDPKRHNLTAEELKSDDIIVRYKMHLPELGIVLNRLISIDLDKK